MLKNLSSEEALNLFELAAGKHAEATERSDYKAANKTYGVIEESIKVLNEQNGRLLLLKFLKHNSVGVRMWASTYLLPTNEDEATKVLKEIAAGEGIHSLTANTTLSEWKKGKLKS